MAATFTNVNRVTYPVGGSTLSEALDEMSAREEAGAASWQPNLSYAFGDDGTVTSATIEVTLTIEMPEWSGYANANNAQRAEWDRWYAALLAHEEGHIQLARDYLTDADSALIGLTENEAQTRFQQICSDLQVASDSYDEGTDHGRTAGTIMDLNADPSESESEEQPQQ